VKYRWGRPPEGHSLDLTGKMIFLGYGKRLCGGKYMAGLPLSDDEIARLNDSQLANLEELGLVATKKLKLESMIEEYNRQAVSSQKQMGFINKEDPRGLHEDPEVQQLLTIKARYKVGNLNEQIKRILRRSVELGLDKFAIIQRQCRIYGIELPSAG
jgi:hypothetical protein